MKARKKMRKPNSRELSYEQVKERLRYPLKQTDITTVLYDLGRTLVIENQARMQRLTSKAMATLVYAGAVLAFLVVQAPAWSLRATAIERTLVDLSVVAATLAMVSAFLAVWNRSWEWFSDESWFNAESIVDAESLRRCHVLCMHSINQTNTGINERREQWVRSAHLLVLCAAALLAAAFLF